MSNDSLIIENVDLSHIHLAVKENKLTVELFDKKPSEN